MTTNEQKISGTGGCSLQEAIYSANLHNNVAVDFVNSDGTDHFVTTQCVPGTGNDTIVLPFRFPFLMKSAVVDRFNYLGATATPMITSHITLEANSALLEWYSPDSYARLFAVGVTGSLTIRNAEISSFGAKGGDGGCGGGGGLGAGGAVYVTGGALIVENSTLEYNRAVAGNGGRDCDLRTYAVAGGGGGGFSGNGAQPNVSGGGGGGSRGNGGAGINSPAGGGGGGGTLTNGGSSLADSSGGAGGFVCGAPGGANGQNGIAANCAGGGGGGAGCDGGCGIPTGNQVAGRNGGDGNYGGGGGGGSELGSGGTSTFGGGGGGGGMYGGCSNGGFGGGGGGGGAFSQNHCTGQGGAFARDSNQYGYGGDGAALGGAIFNEGGSVTIRNSTFYRSSAGTFEQAGYGSAIFSLNGSLSVFNVTVGAGLNYSNTDIYVFSNGSASFKLFNTIVENCGTNSTKGAILNVTGAGNLSLNQCPGAVPGWRDPQLGPPQVTFPGTIPTIAITPSSPAYRTADPATSLPTDERGVARLGGYDIGAFDLCFMGNPMLQMPCRLSAGIELLDPLTVQVSPPGAGSVNPAPGVNNEPVNSLVGLQAVPNPNFAFVGWEGNVADPANPSTAIVMNGPQTVTAMFVASGGPATISGLAIAGGAFTVDFTTHVYSQTVVIKNILGVDLIGPFSLALDSLPSEVTVANPSGYTSATQPAGSAYINFGGANFQAGASLTLQLQFTDPVGTAITYTPRVLAGPGSR